MVLGLLFLLVITAADEKLYSSVDILFFDANIHYDPFDKSTDIVVERGRSENRAQTLFKSSTLGGEFSLRQLIEANKDPIQSRSDSGSMVETSFRVNVNGRTLCNKNYGGSRWQQESNIDHALGVPIIARGRLQLSDKMTIAQVNANLNREHFSDEGIYLLQIMAPDQSDVSVDASFVPKTAKCQNGGYLAYNKDLVGGNHQCFCQRFFYGLNCRYVQCFNGGVPGVGDTADVCHCPPGYNGQHCEAVECKPKAVWSLRADGNTLAMATTLVNSPNMFQYLLPVFNNASTNIAKTMLTLTNNGYKIDFNIDRYVIVTSIRVKSMFDPNAQPVTITAVYRVATEEDFVSRLSGLVDGHLGTEEQDGLSLMSTLQTEATLRPTDPVYIFVSANNTQLDVDECAATVRRQAIAFRNPVYTFLHGGLDHAPNFTGNSKDYKRNSYGVYWDVATASAGGSWFLNVEDTAPILQKLLESQPFMRNLLSVSTSMAAINDSSTVSCSWKRDGDAAKIEIKLDAAYRNKPDEGLDRMVYVVITGSKVKHDGWFFNNSDSIVVRGTNDGGGNVYVGSLKVNTYEERWVLDAEDTYPCAIRVWALNAQSYYIGYSSDLRIDVEHPWPISGMNTNPVVAVDYGSLNLWRDHSMFHHQVTKATVSFYEADGYTQIIDNTFDLTSAEGYSCSFGLRPPLVPSVQLPSWASMQLCAEKVNRTYFYAKVTAAGSTTASSGVQVSEMFITACDGYYVETDGVSNSSGVEACHNNGTYDYNAQACNCDQGTDADAYMWTGAKCDVPICYNGGNLTETDEKGVVMKCSCDTTLWRGEHCEIPLLLNCTHRSPCSSANQNGPTLSLVIQETSSMTFDLYQAALFLVYLKDKKFANVRITTIGYNVAQQNFITETAQFLTIREAGDYLQFNRTPSITVDPAPSCKIPLFAAIAQHVNKHAKDGDSRYAFVDGSDTYVLFDLYNDDKLGGELLALHALSDHSSKAYMFKTPSNGTHVNHALCVTDELNDDQPEARLATDSQGRHYSLKTKDDLLSVLKGLTDESSNAVLITQRVYPDCSKAQDYIDFIAESADSSTSYVVSISNQQLNEVHVSLLDDVILSTDENNTVVNNFTIHNCNATESASNTSSGGVQSYCVLSADSLGVTKAGQTVRLKNLWGQPTDDLLIVAQTGAVPCSVSVSILSADSDKEDSNCPVATGDYLAPFTPHIGFTNDASLDYETKNPMFNVATHLVGRWCGCENITNEQQPTLVSAEVFEDTSTYNNPITFVVTMQRLGEDNWPDNPSCYSFWTAKPFTCQYANHPILINLIGSRVNSHGDVIPFQRGVTVFCTSTQVCANGGTLDETTNKCNCAPGYSGQYCDTVVCPANIESNPGTGQCTCPLVTQGGNRCDQEACPNSLLANRQSESTPFFTYDKVTVAFVLDQIDGPFPSVVMTSISKWLSDASSDDDKNQIDRLIIVVASSNKENNATYSYVAANTDDWDAFKNIINKMSSSYFHNTPPSDVRSTTTPLRDAVIKAIKLSGRNGLVFIPTAGTGFKDTDQNNITLSNQVIQQAIKSKSVKVNIIWTNARTDSPWAKSAFVEFEQDVVLRTGGQTYLTPMSGQLYNFLGVYLPMLLKSDLMAVEEYYSGSKAPVVVHVDEFVEKMLISATMKGAGSFVVTDGAGVTVTADTTGVEEIAAYSGEVGTTIVWSISIDALPLQRGIWKIIPSDTTVRRTMRAYGYSPNARIAVGYTLNPNDDNPYVQAPAAGKDGVSPNNMPIYALVYSSTDRVDLKTFGWALSDVVENPKSPYDQTGTWVNRDAKTCTARIMSTTNDQSTGINCMSSNLHARGIYWNPFILTLTGSHNGTTFERTVISNCFTHGCNTDGGYLYNGKCECKDDYQPSDVSSTCSLRKCNNGRPLIIDGGNDPDDSLCVCNAGWKGPNCVTRLNYTQIDPFASRNVPIGDMWTV